MYQLNLNNEYRTVLTEVLPYEIPLMLDNIGFYQNIREKKIYDVFLKQFSFLTNNKYKNEWCKPFNYYVRRPGGHSRLLSIMHPLNQLTVVDFYQKYADYLLYLCNKSPFSIRSINGVSKCIFDIDEKDIDVDSEVEENQINKVYPSYFNYKGYTFYHKFFDSVDQVRLEQKYKYCMKLDLSKCFYNIYTHSIAWAIKGKEYAKENQRSDSLEHEFDTLMQRCNYNETNGILVGPEISRIFAEIILQRIDLNILEELKKNDILFGKDYEVRRYVDDYLIYGNDKKLFDTIKKVCEKKFEQYKLYINEKKIKFIERPFSTDISSAKNEILKLVQETNDKYFVLDNDGKYAKSFDDSSKGLISFAHKFSSIAHQNNVDYSEINRYCLSLIKGMINNQLAKDIEPSEGQILSIMEISFYLFSLDMNYVGSFKISRIIEGIVDWCNKISDIYIRQKIMDRLYREAKRCFDVYNSTSKDNQTNIEIMNLLLVLCRKTKFDINGDLIKSIFNLKTNDGINQGFEKLDYFQICTILYVLEQKDSEILSALVNEIKRRFGEKEKPLRYSELALLYFDILTCPYIDEGSKLEIYTCVQKKENSERKKMENIGAMNRVVKAKKWFFDWDKNKKISSILDKKEYIPAYQ